MLAPGSVAAPGPTAVLSVSAQVTLLTLRLRRAPGGSATRTT
jgi:hypothetical protein